MARRSAKQQKSDFFESALDGLPYGVLVAVANGEGNGEMIFANRELLDLFECADLDDLKRLSGVGNGFLGLVYPHDQESVRWFIRRYSRRNQKDDSSSDDSDSTWQYQRSTIKMHYRIRTKTGRIVPVMESDHYSKDPDHGLLVNCMMWRARRPPEIDEQDHLTGLPDIRSFVDYAEQLSDRNRRNPEDAVPIHYLLVNICRFKLYNLAYGSDAGDRLLQLVAHVLKKCFPQDAYVARYGADRFVICSTSPDYLQSMKDAYQSIITARPEAAADLKVGIYDADTAEADVGANAAVDLAKFACDTLKDVPNRVYRIYERKLADTVDRDKYIAESVERAIESGYIQVYYQPIVRSVSGDLCGFEALARWVDPIYGFMNPREFIPVLERAQQMQVLDFFVFQQACAQIRGVRQKHEQPVPISVNISCADFLSDDVYRNVVEICDGHKVPYNMLRIEISESSLAGHDEQVLESVAKLRSAGFQVCIDGFGSGNSSLDMLKHFHFDAIKFDMGFMRDDSDASRAIISSTVRMSKDLGIHTMIEGVETQEQADFLREAGCEKLQGFFFGRPVPYEESLRHCMEELHMGVEGEENDRYFDRIGMVDLQTEKPLLIWEFDYREGHRILFANQAAEELAHDVGYPSTSDLLIREDAEGTAASDRIKTLITRTQWNEGTDEDHDTFVMVNGCNIRLSFSIIATASRFCRAFRVIMKNLTPGGPDGGSDA
jgi:diguanylate cyclase (GGDEF)-like protein